MTIENEKIELSNFREPILKKPEIYYKIYKEYCKNNHREESSYDQFKLDLELAKEKAQYYIDNYWYQVSSKYRMLQHGDPLDYINGTEVESIELDFLTFMLFKNLGGLTRVDIEYHIKKQKQVAQEAIVNTAREWLIDKTKENKLIEKINYYENLLNKWYSIGETND